MYFVPGLQTVDEKCPPFSVQTGRWNGLNRSSFKSPGLQLKLQEGVSFSRILHRNDQSEASPNEEEILSATSTPPNTLRVHLFPPTHCTGDSTRKISTNSLPDSQQSERSRLTTFMKLACDGYSPAFLRAMNI
eukprot:752742-Hanusia_phi.AAC.1